MQKHKDPNQGTVKPNQNVDHNNFRQSIEWAKAQGRIHPFTINIQIKHKFLMHSTLQIKLLLGVPKFPYRF
jgi:hypothetical protein